jgi:TPR repeat protein/tRNA A-37 threonylcarbamoyl transferase component Bud32
MSERDTVSVSEARIAEIRPKAEKGDADAQYELGRCYEEGNGVPKDARTAALWYKRASQQNHPEATLAFACCYRDGIGVPPDGNKAKQLYEKAAELGEAAAYIELSKMYCAPNDNKDLAEAERVLLKALADGNMDAYSQLGAMFEAEGDLRKAAEFYEKAAENGDLRAQYDIGWMYKNAEGVKKDLEKAAKWMVLAADRGSPYAQNDYGIMLQYGQGVEQNEELAVEYYRKAIEGNVIAAKYNLAFCYLDGVGVEQDSLEAYDLLKQAADADYLEAQFELGRLLAEGKHLSKNEDEAMQWLERASDAGHAGATYHIGTMLLDRGDPESVEAAVGWLRSAVEAGYEYSEMQLGWAILMHENPELYDEGIDAVMKSRNKGEIGGEALLGRLYEKKGDLKEALDWSMIPAREGDPYAQSVVGRLFDHMGDEEEAVKWFTLAAESGDSYACFYLARIHEGRDDRDTALDWYERAMDMGNDVQADIDNIKAGGELQSRTDRVTSMSMEQPAQKRDELPAVYKIYEHCPPGSIIAEKYLIESVIGKGGMAMVFKAKHLLMERTVAIKMMLPECAADESSAKRFQREAQAASSLSHPNVINVYDFGVIDGDKPYIVMDYLEGVSLESVVEDNGPMPPSRAIPIMVQVCDAMNAAHEAGIIHRDLKPSNIMLTNTKKKEDFVKVVDFGIAKMNDDNSQAQQKLTRTGQVFGSLVYMSPEQCMGKKLDNRSDIYSLGCVLFEILTAELPFVGDTVFETMTKHIQEAPPAIAPLISYSSCAAEIEEIINKSLAKDPDHRFQTMNEFKDALSKLKVD